MYDLLLAQFAPKSFAERAKLLAFREFAENRQKPFNLGMVSAFAGNIADEYARSGLSETLAIQVPIGNSIVVVIVGIDAIFSAKVQHSFGGLYFSPMDKLFQFDRTGSHVSCFIHVSKVAGTPSYVRTTPDLRVLNNGVCWSDGYLNAQTIASLVKVDDASFIDHERETADSLVIDETVMIAIPVYNSPHLFTKLLADLKNSLPDQENIEVLIVDDCGDDYSARSLQTSTTELAASFKNVKISLERHKTNIGFIKSCNEIFERGRQRDLFILLTTDIRLPDQWLERMVAAFRSEKDIAVATPWAINGANLSVDNLPGHSWRDMDDLARKHFPTFPDAETTVGYCMGVRPSALGGNETLFSLAFENGYGDDSDLYFRMVSKNLRGVVVDNMVIYHQGGGSFDLLENVEDLRADNFKIFSSFWMQMYKERVYDVIPIHNSLREARLKIPKQKSCEILFVLPLDYRKAGGVEAVFKIVEGLRDAGVKADIYCTRHHEDAEKSKLEYRAYSTCDVPRIEQLPRYIGRPKIVVATSHDTTPYVHSFTSMVGGQAWHFVQGPEMAFSSGAFSALVSNDLRNADRILCVSEYLADLILALTGKKATVIPYGPDPMEFYSAGTNHPKTVAVQFAGRADKGSDLAGIAVPILLNHGYTIEAFGEVSDYFDYDQRIKSHGFANPKNLRKIFQKSSHYLDLSHYEGLGMLSLEALFCGAMPISMRNGGAATLLEKHGAGILLDGIGDLHKLPGIIEARSANIDLHAGISKIQEEANVQAAVRRFYDLVRLAA